MSDGDIRFEFRVEVDAESYAALEALADGVEELKRKYAINESSDGKPRSTGCACLIPPTKVYGEKHADTCRKRTS